MHTQERHRDRRGSFDFQMYSCSYWNLDVNLVLFIFSSSLSYLKNKVTHFFLLETIGPVRLFLGSDSWDCFPTCILNLSWNLLILIPCSPTRTGSFAPNWNTRVCVLLAGLLLCDLSAALLHVASVCRCRDPVHEKTLCLRDNKIRGPGSRWGLKAEMPVLARICSNLTTRPSWVSCSHELAVR
jgi:hypothetical protein